MVIPKDAMECGTWGDRRITPDELEAAAQTVRLCSGLSRQELARTLCEHLGWMTASGSHKVTAGLNVLEEMEQQGLVRLPEKQRFMCRSTEQASGAVPDPQNQPRTATGRGVGRSGIG